MNSTIKTEKDFAYHEILTDSNNIVKDIAKLLAMGIESEEITDEYGDVVKIASPVIDKCWEVVYPKQDKVSFPNIGDWENLLPEEYKAVTDDQINRATDTIILKTTTIPKGVKVNKSTQIGVNKDLNVDTATMYLELYMPKYLCDSESDDVMKQRLGEIHKVIDVNSVRNIDGTGVVYDTRVARNYHHLFMRIFDNINENGDGPADNVYDPVTRDIIEWNSRTSCWSKLSWYTDFEDKFVAPLVGEPSKGMQLGSIRVPVISGLTGESKIKLWVNMNRNRAVLGVMGSPNVDFSDNRYLVGCSYIGQIESFEFGVNDTIGNFGLFTTSSSSPAMGKTETLVRPLRNGIISGNAVTNNSTNAAQSRNKMSLRLSTFNPGVEYVENLVTISDIPFDHTKPDGGSDWGTRYIDGDSLVVETTITNSYDTRYVFWNDENGIAQTLSISPVYGTVPLTGTIKINPNNKKDISFVFTVEDILKAVLGATNSNINTILKGSSIKFGYNTAYMTTFDFYYKFKYYTEYDVQTGGVKRDKFGNPVSVEFDSTYGKNTATGVTDFAMYATFSKDYFQRHYFMFAATEEYMQKELYGKSAYTGEYFADRIKVVHSSEGPRGILSGLITIDTSSLYAFDELVVNKEFKKYADKPEELYLYLPVTAPYCPFANSVNGRHGVGILKDIRYAEPKTDEEIVDAAIKELERKYCNINIVVEDFPLIEESTYGASISWESDNTSSIEIE